MLTTVFAGTVGGSQPAAATASPNATVGDGARARPTNGPLGAGARIVGTGRLRGTGCSRRAARSDALRARARSAPLPATLTAMSKTLVIAEKPSVGQDLARVLPGPFQKQEG